MLCTNSEAGRCPQRTYTASARRKSWSWFLPALWADWGFQRNLQPTQYTCQRYLFSIGISIPIDSWHYTGPQHPPSFILRLALQSELIGLWEDVENPSYIIDDSCRTENSQFQITRQILALTVKHFRRISVDIAMAWSWGLFSPTSDLGHTELLSININ